MNNFLKELHKKDLARKDRRSGLFLLYKEDDNDLPTSKEYIAATTASIGHQEKRIKQNHALETRVGLELEFATYRETIDTPSVWKDVKAAILSGQRIDSPEYDAIAQFGPREVMIYDLLHIDERTQDILEPLQPGKYYDGGDMLELKLKPVAPSRLIENLNKVSEILYEKITQTYGLVFYEKGCPGTHINLSFWDDGGNLLEKDHPEFATKGKAVVEGVLRALFDSFAIQLDNLQLTKEIDESVTLTVDRTGAVRFAKGRAEIRPTGENRNFDPMLLLSIGLAGAEYALDQPASDYLAPAVMVNKASAGEHEADLKVVAHVINGSVIDENGKLKVPSAYIRQKAEKIAEELKLIAPSQQSDHNARLMALFGQDPPYVQPILAFFQGIRLQQRPDNSFDLIWPETHKGVYAFVAKESDQADARQLVYQINTARLKDSLPVLSAYPAFISDGYRLGSALPDTQDVLDAYEKRMQQSPLLTKLNGAVRDGMIADLHERASHVRKCAEKSLKDFGLDLAKKAGIFIMPGRPVGSNTRPPKPPRFIKH